MFDSTCAPTPFLRPNGFGTVASIPTHEKDLLRRFEPQQSEIVLTRLDVLNTICTQHDAFHQVAMDHRFGLLKYQVVKRRINLSDLMDRLGTHEKGDGDRIKNAVEFWSAKGFLSLCQESNGGAGRPSTYLDLNLAVFSNTQDVQVRWHHYWDPIRAELLHRRVKEITEALARYTWIARVDFQCHDQQGTIRAFKIGAVIPLDICVRLQGMAEEPDLSKIEPLGNRVIVQSPHQCKCSFPIDPNSFKKPAPQSETQKHG